MLVPLAVCLALQQGPPATQWLADPRENLHIAEPVAASCSAPFVDGSGNASVTDIAAAGLADLDGDGNLDAWFLAGAGPRAGDLAVMVAQTAGIGRFVPFGGISATTFVTGATLRRQGVADLIVLSDPTATAPTLLSYQPGLSDPRAGSFVLVPAGFTLGPDVRALSCFDADGDGNDDLIATLDLRTLGQITGTRIAVLHFGTGTFGYSLLSTASIDLGLPGLRATPADFDGDGRTDLCVDVDGFGVVGLLDDAAGSFTLRSFVGVGAGALRDVAVADFDGDGRDDQALALSIGVIVVLADASGDTQHALLADPAAAPIGAVALIDVDHDGDRDVIGLPAHGGNFALWRFRSATRDFGPGEVFVPPASASELATGIGAQGIALARGDLDRDGDDDVLWQIPTGDRWLTVAGTTADRTPLAVREQNIGTLSAVGFQRQDFTVDLPGELLQSGAQDVEFAVFIENPSTGELVFWDRDVITLAPGATAVVVPVQIMIDPLNAQWVWQSHVTRHPLTGELCAVGNTVISVHGKSGTRRFASALASWDGHGQNGPHGSAVGVRWNVVAPPPLPKNDQQLLPWD